jgi:hypothetical protein
MNPPPERSEHMLGASISRHGRSRTAVVALLASVVVMLCGAFLAYVLLATDARVDPSRVPLLIGVAAGLVVVGLLMLLGWKLMAPKATLVLHENGVAVHRRGTATVEPVPFADMEDVYLFRTGGYAGGIINALAFRRALDEPWITVLDDRRNSFALRAAIVDRYVVARLPASLATLDAGGTVRFHAISRTARHVKRLIGGALKVDVHTVALSAQGIDVQGTFLPLERIHRIDGVGSDGQVRLLDEHGKVVHSFDYLCLFSADLFLALLAELLQRRAPAYQGLMAH